MVKRIPPAICGDGIPTKSETTVIVHGIGNAFWHFLFVMLYITLRKNQAKKQTPRRAVRTIDCGPCDGVAEERTRVGGGIAARPKKSRKGRPIGERLLR